MKVRSDASEVAVCDARRYLLGGRSDEIERSSVIDLLESLVAIRLNSEVVNLEGSFFFMSEGSSLHVVWKTVSVMLKDLVESEAFQEILTSKGAIDRRQVFVTSSGRMNILLKNGYSDIAQELNADPLDAPRLQALVAAANATGGEIRLTNTVNVAQWMRFHGLKLPTDVGQVHKLLSFLKWNWPESDKLGFYWEHIRGHDGDSVVLTEPQCQEIRALKKKLSPGPQSLLGILYKNVQATIFEDISGQNANEIIAKIVRHPSSQALAKKYIEALEWYGSRKGEHLEEDDLSQFLITAILLDLELFNGKGETRNHIDSFDIYQPWDTVDKPLSIVRHGLEQYLLLNRRISGKLVPLVSHLLLADLAPGFLVKGIPFDLTVGSLGWVTFSQTVAFIEMKSRGASRFMTYNQVMEIADMDAPSSSMGQLQSLAAVEAIIDWALVNEVITHDELEASVNGASASAISAYERYVNRLAQSSNIWAELPPSRQKIALEALKKAAPGCDFLEKPLLRHFADQFNSKPKVSMLDLHIEGELQGQEWDWGKDKSLFKIYPGLIQLMPNQAIFEDAAREHHRKLHEALSTNIKFAMACMPSHDRDIYEKSSISFFTIRPPVGTLVYPSTHSTGYTGVNNRPPELMETQAQRDEATGRFGVIMYVSSGNDQYLCYEMFNLRGELRRNDELGALIQKVGKDNFSARLDFTGRLDDLLPAATTLNYAPVDLESYTHGSAPRENRTSIAIIEKLGTLAAPTLELERKCGIYQHFVCPRFNEIAQFITTYRPLATVREYTEAITELTEREQVRATTEKVITYVVDLVVPFKKCIEDIVSGDKNRLVDGLYGCTMDAIGILFTVLGATSKLLSIASRTASLVSKFVSVGKFGLKLMVSTFNPIDGLPTAGYRLSKTLYRGGLRLSKEGVQLVELASFQLRRLTGKASSVDLLKLDNVPQLGTGKWRPRSGSADVMDVCAIAKNSHWYGVNRFGRPWGKRLDFDWKHPFTVPDVRHELPVNYIHHVIEQSMGIATRKIDNAIVVLTTPSLKLRTDPAIGLFLGTTPQVRDDLLAFLKIIKTDFAGWSPSNVLLDPLKGIATTLQIKPLDFTKWKSAAMSQKADHQFLSVNPKNLNDRLSAEGSNYGDIADDLIHEMFRAASARKDMVIATAATEANKGLNVAPLLNLVAGRLPESTREENVRYHDSGKAIENADSCTLATALLSQVVTDYSNFSANVGIMSSAVTASTIDTEVWLNLNTK